MNKFIIVAHKYLPQPDDDFVFFLNKQRKEGVVHIMHNFPDAQDRKSFCYVYQKGKKLKLIKTIDFSFLPEPLIYLKEFIYTILWIFGWEKKSDLYVGMDGLCVLFGLVLKRFGLVKKVVYWNIDFVPFCRFSAGWKNKIYHWVNLFAVKNADEVWDLSPRMALGRKKYFGIGKKDYKKYRIVPYGVWTKRIKKIPFNKCQKTTLVFMGHLLPKQGVDIIIKNIHSIILNVPNFRFKIIGSGNYKSTLVGFAKDLGVLKYCDFVGRIGDSRELEKEIAKSAVAIAPYKRTKDNYTYYSDSGKVKTYLACGVPVLLTNFPWNANVIEKNKCGLIIKDDGKDLIGKLIYLMEPKTNSLFRRNAARYSKNFNYGEIFMKLDI